MKDFVSSVILPSLIGTILLVAPIAAIQVIVWMRAGYAITWS